MCLRDDKIWPSGAWKEIFWLSHLLLAVKTPMADAALSWAWQWLNCLILPPPPLSELNFEQVSNDIRISFGRKKDLLEMKIKSKNFYYFCYRIKKIHSYNIYITATGAKTNLQV